MTKINFHFQKKTEKAAIKHFKFILGVAGLNILTHLLNIGTNISI